MNKELFDDIHGAIKARKDWEDKQEMFYRMRNKGLKRRSKPYEGAPDMHYALADGMIEKLKPLFIGQLFGDEYLASFVATEEQSAEATLAAAQWFDYQLKQESNFQREMFVAVDGHLQNGFAIVKVYWDARARQVSFCAVDPLHIIVPDWTEELQASDFFVHVMHLSEAQYRRNPLYNQDDDFVKSIKGKGNRSGDTLKDQAIASREGLTYGTGDTIVLWEVYRPETPDEGAGLVVDTISPVRGWEEEVRATFGLPFTHKLIPFFKIRAEITDKGWYSPRGVTEVVAPHEASLNKVWNGKLQHLDFHGTPTYENTGSSPLPNGSNFRQPPGGILPPGVKPVDNPPAPIDFEKEMQFTRALAEDRVSVPDLSASEHLSGNRGASGERVTATQINAIVGQSGQGNDLRARNFRLDLVDGYMLAWGVLLQYKKDELTFLLDGKVKQVPPEALHGKYIINPNGSPDSWNKGAQFQKAIALFQMFRGDPYINQGELRKIVLELDDARRIKRLFQDPGVEQKKQGEQQAQEITVMLIGWPVEVSEADDDKVHIVTLDQFAERRATQREQLTPEFARLWIQHRADHANALAQKKDPAAQAARQPTAILQFMDQLAAQPDQPTNVVQMQPAPGNAPGPTPQTQTGQGSGGAASPEDEHAKIEIAKGNLLVNMAKAGMAVNHAEADKVLLALNLPPLATEPIPAVTRTVQPKPQPAGAA